MRASKCKSLASTLSIGVIVFVGIVGMKAATGGEILVATWKEECGSKCNDGTASMRELYGTYSNECFDEGCSTEELNETAGGNQFIDNMLKNFLEVGYKIRSDDLQSQQSPSSENVWWYESCGYTGLMAQHKRGNWNLREDFRDNTGALKIGAGIDSVEVYENPQQAGNSRTFSGSVSCLNDSNFANTIDSIRVIYD